MEGTRCCGLDSWWHNQHQLRKRCSNRCLPSESWSNCTHRVLIMAVLSEGTQQMRPDFVITFLFLLQLSNRPVTTSSSGRYGMADTKSEHS
ncbi:hypothetical protein VNO77_19091 [Canavalia gladiata]|uniref:Uncharacterized protein n=1 Tax=Canavalia gladiata TaxID=3824 RepID=A0AAN9QI79_CANGL